VCVVRVSGTEALARTAAVWHTLRAAWRDASDSGVTAALATTVRALPPKHTRKRVCLRVPVCACVLYMCICVCL
jgi:hypothetical protein